MSPYHGLVTASITEELEGVETLARQYGRADNYDCDKTRPFWPNRGHGTKSVNEKKKVAPC